MLRIVRSQIRQQQKKHTAGPPMGSGRCGGDLAKPTAVNTAEAFHDTLAYCNKTYLRKIRGRDVGAPVRFSSFFVLTAWALRDNPSPFRIDL